MSIPREPIAYVAVADPALRAQIAGVFRSAGWQMIVEPTGFHLLDAITELIEDERAWRLRPSMIVMDAHSRGCSGVSIARGLRDLGITIPIVLLATPDTALPISADATLRVVDREAAVGTVRDLARARPAPRSRAPANDTCREMPTGG